jgi:hypothetical protein
VTQSKVAKWAAVKAATRLDAGEPDKHNMASRSLLQDGCCRSKRKPLAARGAQTKYYARDSEHLLCLCPVCLLLADYCFYTKKFDQPNQPFRCSENTDWAAPSCTDAAHWSE